MTIKLIQLRFGHWLAYVIKRNAARKTLIAVCAAGVDFVKLEAGS